ncbi:hypothetical protein MH117_06355 [Paenibacillus sp. ACRRX]|uniref:TlpA family protein disulfide reductase n=1 Tax=Paenibacillus sp. ACRRX TaxID=2918206 RepID=UPI001EF44D79|nr:hypothetical protein [Paenibacillus sp. ACRRX]MCG7407035.1 hypothetical protein [Paenibacillus sp. ACRRX]
MNMEDMKLPEFLRTNEQWRIGDYLPNITIPNYEDLKLYDLIDDYLLVAALSTNCAPCLPAMKALDAFIQKHPYYKLIMFVVTDEHKFELTKMAFHESARLYIATEEVMSQQIKVRGYPWAYGLNSEGQIITIAHAGRVEFLEKLAAPFSRFHKPVMVAE